MWWQVNMMSTNRNMNQNMCGYAECVWYCMLKRNETSCWNSYYRWWQWTYVRGCRLCMSWPTLQSQGEKQRMWSSHSLIYTRAHNYTCMHTHARMHVRTHIKILEATRQTMAQTIFPLKDTKRKKEGGGGAKKKSSAIFHRLIFSWHKAVHPHAPWDWVGWCKYTCACACVRACVRAHACVSVSVTIYVHFA